MSGVTEEQKQKIQEQLERIISSSTFAGSERHRRFLRFVVEQALTGFTDKLNEFVLGLEVFHKNESFDPRIDSIVRVEARRLRERLKKYYEEEGRADPIVVTLRPRSFIPEFRDAQLEPAGASEPSALRATWSRMLTHKVALLVLAVVVLGAIVTASVLIRRWRRAAVSGSTASVLILPFQTARGQETTGEAIVDSLINGLAPNPELRVISRASGVDLKQSGRSPQQVAADLQVDYIVEGSIQSEASSLRVSVKMTDVHTQSYVWAATRAAAPSELNQLGREFTSAISSRIRFPRPAAETPTRRRRPANFQAYGTFLKGQYYWYQQDRDSAEKSIALFEEAVRTDPNFAPAWAWLSLGYHLLATRSEGRDTAALRKGRQAAQKAVSLDGDLGEAHAAVACYSVLDWDWATAEREFRQALKLSPNWAQGHLMYALLYLVPNGELRPAVGEMLQAHELDPLTSTTRSMLAEAFYFNREYDRAISESEDMRKPDVPTFDDRRYYLSLSLSGQNRRALTELLKKEGARAAESPSATVLAYLLAKDGQRAKAESILRQMMTGERAGPFSSALSIAMVNMGLGNRDEVLRQLRKAVNDRIPALPFVLADPVFDPVRNDPEFNNLLRTVGLKAAR
jgi:serine/threonine-protein kinase